jgi:hypothetical protein
MEKWKREKARLAAGGQADTVQEFHNANMVADSSSVYRKPGEFCPHPEDMLATMKGYKVCLACGVTLEEGVSKSQEELDEDRSDNSFIATHTHEQKVRDTPILKIKQCQEEDDRSDQEFADEEDGKA